MCTLHAGQLRQQTHTNNIQDLLLFRGNSGYVRLSVILKLAVMFFSTRTYVQETSYIHNRPSCNVRPQKTYRHGHICLSLCGCACLGQVTTGLSLVKFGMNVLPVQDIPDCLFYRGFEIWGCHKYVAEDSYLVGCDTVIGRVVLVVEKESIGLPWASRSPKCWLLWHHIT
jgi:hypothetical protein